MSKLIEINNYNKLKQQIGDLLQEGRRQAGRTVNTILVHTYWHIGQHIVEYQQGGREKSEYGSELLDRLSKDLKGEFGKGFSRSNLYQIRQLYLSLIHISEPTRRTPISYAVFCLKKKK